jgi:alkylated DNA nucleotide flippase Atl1
MKIMRNCTCATIRAMALRAPRSLPPDEREARILERIRAIPKGFVRTYGDIDPAAPRLVGRVLAVTQEKVPWHRVVRADGTVAKGEKQLALLRREGVPLRGNRVDLRDARLPE